MKKNQGGFTLIEMLLAVLLLALTVGLTSDMLLSLIRSNTKTQVINELEQQANFVTLKIEKELRDAVSVNTNYDANCQENYCLRFTKRDGTVITYRNSATGSSSRLERLVGTLGPTNNFVPITSESSPGGVNVTPLEDDRPYFEIIGTDPQVVKVNMLFEQAQVSAGPTYSGDVKIESSIVIRSTY